VQHGSNSKDGTACSRKELVASRWSISTNTWRDWGYGGSRVRPATHRLEVVGVGEDPEALLARRFLLRRDRRRAVLHLPGARTYTCMLIADMLISITRQLVGSSIRGADLAVSTEQRTVASGGRRGRRSCGERRSAAPAPAPRGVVTRRDPAGE
jgi:hypothetical protein